MAKKFAYMSQNEWLGDPTTHFMKSGSTIRSPANKAQEALANLLPRVVNGVKVEYDIAYDNPHEVSGYKFSDFLTNALYIGPQSGRISTEVIAEVASRPATEEGYAIFDKLRDSMEDKYILDEDFDAEIDTIVVLPGTNLLSREDTVDFDKIDQLVREGAYVKIHPITERTWEASLRQRWGKQVIGSDVSLYPILRACNRVMFTMSSETGLAATLLGKKIGLIDHPKKKAFSTFQHLYGGMDRARNGSLRERFSSLLSHPESGILTTYHKNPEERIRAFFEFMTKYPHKKMPIQ